MGEVWPGPDYAVQVSLPASSHGGTWAAVGQNVPGTASKHRQESHPNTGLPTSH